MDYNELRISNKIYNIASGSKEVCEVEAITRLGVQYNSETRQGTCSMDNLEPIGITKEWFIKFGFEDTGVIFKLNGINLWYSTYSKNYHFRYYLIGNNLEKKRYTLNTYTNCRICILPLQDKNYKGNSRIY